ncbi:DUF362 domain-containing protein [bacterium]|nr:DUF362 domain-containing protein [candidate division CSSED10-310 bacterium]
MSTMSKPTFISHRQHVPESPAAYGDGSLRLIKDMVAEALAGCGMMPGEIRGKRIMIKPNLVRPNLELQPTVSTDPRVVIALCELLVDYGGRVTVGENPGYGFSARAAFRAGGLAWPLRRMNVDVCFFDEDLSVRIDNPRGLLLRWIYAARSLVDAELLVNVPKLKTHMHTLVSLCFKNLQGVLLDPQRRLFHREDIHQKIVDTALAFTPHLNVVDGLWAMEGQAPFFGRSIPDCNVIVAGQDMLHTDVVCARLMGVRPEEVSHLRIAAAMGFGDLDINRRPLAGVPVESAERRFLRPVVSNAGAYPGITVIEAGACSGCMSGLRHSLDKLNFEGRLGEVGECTIFMGRPMPNTKNLRCWRGTLWLFGNCAVDLVFSHPERRLAHRFLPGCAPHVLDFYQAVTATAATHPQP